MYFNALFLKYKEFVQKQNSIANPLNEIYSPELFNIVAEQIYLMPLWSGLILAKWNEKFPNYKCLSRVTNNPVENYFGKLKNCLLIKKQVRPSLLTAFMYSRLLAKYLQFYNDSIINLSKPSKEKIVADYMEQWYPKKKLKKNSFSYYDKISNFGFINDEVEKKIQKVVDDSEKGLKIKIILSGFLD